MLFYESHPFPNGFFPDGEKIVIFYAVIMIKAVARNLNEVVGRFLMTELGISSSLAGVLPFIFFCGSCEMPRQKNFVSSWVEGFLGEKLVSLLEFM